MLRFGRMRIGIGFEGDLLLEVIDALAGEGGALLFAESIGSDQAVFGLHGVDQVE